MKHFLVFGTHPLLSLAEAKAILGGAKPETAQELAVFDDRSWDGIVLQDRLAGTVKLGDVLAEIPNEELNAERLADFIDSLPRADRVLFGLSVYGGSSNARVKTSKLGLALKRVLQTRGRSARWVTGDTGDLSPAAVAKMKLTTEGYDFVIGLLGDRTVIGLTTHVQDADAWSLRDFGRPFRDTLTGMLPPKLARMLVNLAIGSGTRNAERGTLEPDAPGSAFRAPRLSLLDPFCGGGTILMEAALMGVEHLTGSDIDAKQIAGTMQNADWMVVQHLISEASREQTKLLTQPAETLDRHLAPESIDAIATEGYLGKPLHGNEKMAQLERQKKEIEDLWKKSLTALHPILKKSGRIVCVWPVFAIAHGTVAVDIRADLPALGYHWIDAVEGWKDRPPTLTYARPDQHVKRNIVVMEKQ